MVETRSSRPPTRALNKSVMKSNKSIAKRKKLFNGAKREELEKKLAEKKNVEETVVEDLVANVSEREPENVALEDVDATIEQFLQFVEDASAEPEPEHEPELEPAPRVTEPLFKDTLVCTPAMIEARYSRTRAQIKPTVETNMSITKPKLMIPAATPFSKKRKEPEVAVEKQNEDTIRMEDVFGTSDEEDAAEDVMDNSNDQAVAEDVAGVSTEHGAEARRVESVAHDVEGTAVISNEQEPEPGITESVAEGMPPEKSFKRKRGRPRKYGPKKDLTLDLSTFSSTPALSSFAPSQTKSASHGAKESQLDPSVSQHISGFSAGVSDSGQLGDEHLGSKKPKKIVHFNDKGQPIGEGSAPFTSYLGAIMRKHLPICYEKWRDVPDQTKDFIWNLVTDKYIVPMAYKAKVMDRIHNYWRSFKSLLRSKYYDTYHTDEERKRNCPTGIKQDVWELFVDNQSTPVAQARRKAGKIARQAMKTPHTSGRTGAARLAETLKKGNPHATVTRTDIYLAMHSRKDGSCPTPELTRKVEQIKAIVQQNPTSVNLDVDHDPVAQVCGRERGGRYVRAMGVGVSRSSLLHSAPALDQLQKERQLRISDEERIADLREQVVIQRKQIGQLQHERKFRIAAEAQIADLREQINSQGLMIADMKELMMRLCS